MKIQTALFRSLITLLATVAAAASLSHANRKTDPLAEGTRQIHLDFHTSEHIPNVGEHFDKNQFQKALITGNVNMINIFAKGHHGWSYYSTELGAMHPTLDFDLMGSQIQACKEIGVKVCLYFTVGWSVRDAEMHPEWIYLNKEGTNEHYERIKDKGPDDTFNGWFYLAPEGPYVETIYAQVEEIMKKYDVDGIWYDIVTPSRVNYNAMAQKDFKARGINPDDDEAVFSRSLDKYADFMEKAVKVVKDHNPDATVFFNGSTESFNSYMLGNLRHRAWRFNTKYDLEDLPTAWGGYDIFPWRSKYFGNMDKHVVAMSGKFHTAWGEFGGFKHKDAILYEAASMVAFGANVNIGDQLHPSGIMEMATYENIGYAFDYVEKIEEYGIGADHMARVGLYVGDDTYALEGATMFLLENQINFNVVNTLDDWSEIELLVIPSATVFDEDLPRIHKFVARGGKVIAMGKSLLKDGKPFLNIGADYLGDARYDIDYTLVGEELTEDLVQAPFLNYHPAPRFDLHAGTQVLANIREPYFSRTLSHFSSHKNTPFRLEDAEHPAVWKRDNIVYIAHDIDRQYRFMGARVHRQLFYNIFKMLNPPVYVETDMPSMGRMNLLHQPQQNRYVVHLLYASPIQKGSVRVIEDMPPLYNIPVTIDFPEKVRSARLVPTGEKLSIHSDGHKQKVTVPRLQSHTALVLEY